jgi:mono/diheme cytochrome c family protein
LTPNLLTSPTDLTTSSLISEGSADQILKRLKPRIDLETHTPMVLGRVLTETSLLDVVAYLKSQSGHGPGTSESAGRDLYEGICWTCHGIDGDGKGPAAESLEGAAPRDFTSPGFVIAGRDQEVFAIISLGAADTIHGSKYMAMWGDNFSRQQILDIIAYLGTFQNTNEPR